MRKVTQKRIELLEDEVKYLRNFMYSVNETLAILLVYLNLKVEEVQKYKRLVSGERKETGK